MEQRATAKAVGLHVMLGMATLKRLPDNTKRRLVNARIMWPDYRTSPWDAPLDPEVRLSRVMPTPRELDDLERVLLWLLWLDRRHRVTVAMRGMTLPVAAIMDRLSVSRATVYNIEARGLADIAALVNGGPEAQAARIVKIKGLITIP